MLSVFCTICIILAQYGSSHGKCTDGWNKVLVTSASGSVLFGQKADLIDAVKHGAEVRFYVDAWGGEGYLSSTHNAYFKNGEVCAQALMHVSKSGWNGFQSNVYWWFVLVCTTGNVHMSRWYVGAHTKVSETQTTVHITWFVRLFGNCELGDFKPLLCSEKNGSATCGNKNALADAVDNGADVRVLNHINSQSGYMTPFSNIDINSNVVAGQYLWHVSQTHSGNHIDFQSDAYWWFTMLSTGGTRDMSRWSVGSHQDRGHTSDKVALEWFADTCWTLAYKHDRNGANIKGSKDYLKSAILNGHRVKVIRSRYSIEADNVQIKNGEVSAQLLGQVSKASIQKFQDNAYWHWQHVSTTGDVNTVRYNVGSKTNRGNDDSKVEVSWYIDTRPWTHVLSTSSSGTATFGSKSTLIDAIKAGSMLRFVIHFGGEKLVLQADNIALNNGGTELAAQTIRTISYTNENIRKFQSNPYWSFSIVTTQGDVKTSKWTVGDHENRGGDSKKAVIDWFVN